jgi:hypothetical protein
MTSIIKVDNLQNQCGANIINENAGTITIGASGDTVTLAAGASQSGFGRSGSVNWDTTPKTTGFTAVSGNGYFCDTTSAAFTVTLPATPSAGDIVAIADYNGTALTNNITVGRNSSDINGSATDLTISANYSAVTLVYVDATSGWRSVDSSNPNDIATPPEYVAATGGTVTCCGDYKIHTFTGPGTFTVTSAGNPLGSSSVDYLVVAGGGGAGGGEGTGGGGAGGFREGYNPGSYTASPLATSALPVAATSYPITVGSGGAGGPGGPCAQASNGNPSVFSTITSTAGGAGGAGGGTPGVGNNGGSGGGGGGRDNNPAGSGNTPPVSPPQGQSGGNATTAAGPTNDSGGGGGGATTVGTQGASCGPGGNGGTGATSSINGTPTERAGGGAGGAQSGSPGTASGGGASTPGSNGTTNTGGGGAGRSGSSGDGGSGGSGIVIIRYKFQ